MGAIARIRPVNPPMVNTNINPTAKEVTALAEQVKEAAARIQRILIVKAQGLNTSLTAKEVLAPAPPRRAGTADRPAVQEKEAAVRIQNIRLVKAQGRNINLAGNILMLPTSEVGRRENRAQITISHFPDMEASKAAARRKSILVGGVLASAPPRRAGTADSPIVRGKENPARVSDKCRSFVSMLNLKT